MNTHPGPDDIPDQLIVTARNAWNAAPQKRDGRPTRMRHALAAAWPEIAQRTHPAPACGASTSIQIGPLPHIGPCVLRADHDGPVHQDAAGVSWTDPQPATAATTAAYCLPAGGPHPGVHLTYGPWEASGHQCGDLWPGGCDEPVPERKITARYNGLGDEHLIGYELGDCPACGPTGTSDIREELTAAIRTAAHICEEHCDCDGVHPVLATTARGDRAVYVEGSPEMLAAAVLPVVEASISARLQDVERQRDEALDLLRRASTYLSNACATGRHDDWGANFACAACGLTTDINALDSLRSILTGKDTTAS